MNQSFFQNIEKKTGVNLAEMLKLVQEVQKTNLKDEGAVRNLIKQISKAANKPVKKELEDKLVDTIMNKTEQVNLDTITKMMEKKK